MTNLSIFVDAYKQITDNVFGIEFILRRSEGEKEFTEEKLAYMYSYVKPSYEYSDNQLGAKLLDIGKDVVRGNYERVIPELILGDFMLESDKFYQQERHFPRLCLEDTLYLIAGLGKKVEELRERGIKLRSLGQIVIKSEDQLNALTRLTEGIYMGYKIGSVSGSL